MHIFLMLNVFDESDEYFFKKQSESGLDVSFSRQTLTRVVL